MNKKKKDIKPKDLLIKAVVDDLKTQMEEPSIHPNDTRGSTESAFGSAFLGAASGEADYKDTVDDEYDSGTSSGEAPAGFIGAEKILSKPTPVENPKPVGLDKTVVLNSQVHSSKTQQQEHEKTVVLQSAAKRDAGQANQEEKTTVLGSTGLKQGQAVQPVQTQQPKPPIKQAVAPANAGPVIAPTISSQNSPGPHRSNVQAHSNPPPPVVNARPTGFEAQFVQSENLKISQQRIVELEKENEKLRKENEMLASANELAKQKNEELLIKSQAIERHKSELKEANESELRIFKEGLLAKDNEISRLKTKIEELEVRLANDLRKIRVRERELENRLDLMKLEKNALMRSKDESILELKRRCEIYETEIQSFQNKVLELNRKIEANQDQFGRTVRALRIALTNLEVNENTSSITLAPMKKAE